MDYYYDMESISDGGWATVIRLAFLRFRSETEWRRRFSLNLQLLTALANSHSRGEIASRACDVAACAGIPSSEALERLEELRSMGLVLMVLPKEHEPSVLSFVRVRVRY